jgi:hypothetical protein
MITKLIQAHSILTEIFVSGKLPKKTIFFEVTCSESDAPARVAVLDLENEGGFQKLISQDSSSALRSDHSVLRSGATLASAEPSALAAPSTRP